ncbi:hypothetical protein [Nannocystis punicea]|uniref:Uncharacterized protein n=1 Tax=Nannocystis punicea TaxID=2995304 RepID=A0ABY7HBB5_9BACT|nr:hypothetical protein [Nannocystis poenicansa]WAS96569.1 hypothetical protein O0S08_10460 [Nannocystis poenicansa]
MATTLLLAAPGLGCSMHSGAVVIPFQGPAAKLNDVESSKQYCLRLAESADKRGQAFLGLGIFMGLVASGLAIAGAAMGPDDHPRANWAAENRNAIFIAGGGALAIPTTIMLMRSKNASNASSASASALDPSLADDERMRRCLKAREEWVSARATAAEYAQEGYTKKLEALERAAEAAKEDKKASEEAANDPNATPDEQKRFKEEAAGAGQRLRLTNELIQHTLEKQWAEERAAAPAQRKLEARPEGPKR